MISGRHKRHLLDDPVCLGLLLTLIHALYRPPNFQLLLLLLLLVRVKQGGVAILSLLLLFFRWRQLLLLVQGGHWQGLSSYILAFTLCWVQTGRVQPTDRKLGGGLSLVHERWRDVIR